MKKISSTKQVFFFPRHAEKAQALIILHVKAALEAAAKIPAIAGVGPDKQGILNAYPLANIE